VKNKQIGVCVFVCLFFCQQLFFAHFYYLIAREDSRTFSGFGIMSAGALCHLREQSKESSQLGGSPQTRLNNVRDAHS